MTVQISIANNDEAKNLQAQRPDLFLQATDGHALLETDDFGALFLTCGDSVGAELSALDKTDSRIRLQAYAGLVRWTTENKGVWVGIYPIKTDADSQRKTATVHSDFTNGVITGAIQFKLADGTFVSADAALIASFYEGIQNHIQACYDVEDNCSTDITARVITTNAQIDARFDAIPVLPPELQPRPPQPIV
jgi:hypothetical protein